ncbi:hypothetical protein [Microbacterium sp. Root553]|uniref:hypothetical protein n=1 Tax=Microbacterium sp. Root553 TaxID=1736556 RepID=UPI0006F72023|nr:hypothetical protein [Microbacterium sp. Root553]KQZ23093.1 hypothetical protein ASD43_00940 [Microbacterium sp. Root553]
MTFEDEFDEPAFQHAVAAAREAAQDAAHVILTLKQRPDWASHRPVVELIFYLALIDYETKALIHRLMVSSDDRYVWEKYLALHLHEALQKVPKRISDAIREISRPGTPSHASPAKYLAASQKLKEELKPINTDKDFMTALRQVRNGVAAHHGGKGETSMDASTFWMLTASQGVSAGRSPLQSQFLEYAWRLARAVQDFAHAI